MDKDLFNKEVYQRLNNFGLASYFSLWQSQRKEKLRHTDPTVPSIDYNLIMAINSSAASHAGVEEVEKVSPGFKDRLRTYLQLQTQLLHDLTRANKESTKEVLPFRDWLQGL